MTKPDPDRASVDAAFARALANLPPAPRPPGERGIATRARVTTTTAELAEQAEREANARRGTDVLARLTARRDAVGRWQTPGIENDIRDAIEEIEWLRASKPDNVVTRQELGAITEQVRTMHAALEALLDRLEAKEGKRK